MSKGTAFFAFAAGLATGVALTMLTFTEKGQRIIEAVEKKGTEFFKKTDIDFGEEGEDENV